MRMRCAFLLSAMLTATATGIQLQSTVRMGAEAQAEADLAALVRQALNEDIPEAQAEAKKKDLALAMLETGTAKAPAAPAAPAAPPAAAANPVAVQAPSVLEVDAQTTKKSAPKPKGSVVQSALVDPETGLKFNNKPKILGLDTVDESNSVEPTISDDKDPNAALNKDSSAQPADSARFAACSHPPCPKLLPPGALSDTLALKPGSLAGKSNEVKDTVTYEDDAAPADASAPAGTASATTEGDPTLASDPALARSDARGSNMLEEGAQAAQTSALMGQLAATLEKIGQRQDALERSVADVQSASAALKEKFEKYQGEEKKRRVAFKDSILNMLEKHELQHDAEQQAQQQAQQQAAQAHSAHSEALAQQTKHHNSAETAKEKHAKTAAHAHKAHAHKAHAHTHTKSNHRKTHSKHVMSKEKRARLLAKMLELSQAVQDLAKDGDNADAEKDLKDLGLTQLLEMTSETTHGKSKSPAAAPDLLQAARDGKDVFIHIAGEEKKKAFKHGKMRKHAKKQAGASFTSDGIESPEEEVTDMQELERLEKQLAFVEAI